VVQCYVLAIHAGCENIIQEKFTPAAERERLDALRQSLAAGRARLEPGGHALDTVQEAVRVLEDSPFFNAGRGSVFTHEGRNEMDASIMDGRTLQAGAVAGTSSIRNPVLAARLVMDRSGHVLLTGRGAEQFARAYGLQPVDPAYFYTRERWDEFQWIRKKDLADKPPDQERDKYGTVGAVCLDRRGNLAAASSTGGLVDKKHGRVGDSPIIGAGVYADNASCAVSCTGGGEYFMRRVAAHRVASLMELAKMELLPAVLQVLQEIRNLGGQGGIIAVDRAGNTVMPFTTRGMFRGLARESETDHVAMFGPSGTWQ